MENFESVTMSLFEEEDQYLWANRVLLITEDEEVNFFYLKTLLKRTEAQIIRARNGREAVDIVTKHREDIDLVLMDINMPEMDGYEALRIIRSYCPDLPVIAQTAYTLNNDRRKCLEAGFTDYLEKPVNRLALFRMVNDNFL